MAHSKNTVPDYNHHHLFYEKRTYRRNHILNRLRQFPGFIVPIYVPDHRALHRALEGCPTPSLDVAHDIMDVLRYDPLKTPEYWLKQAIGFFTLNDSLATAEHLQNQLPYVIRRPVIPMQRQPEESYAREVA